MSNNATLIEMFDISLKCNLPQIYDFCHAAKDTLL